MIRHVPYEDLSGLEQPIVEAGYAVRRVDVGTREFEELDWLAPDLLVALGGPMGAYQDDRHPWMAAEKAGLAARIAAERPTVGVCLGAQMIAAALGAEVRRGPVREVGFGEVELVGAGAESPLRHFAGVPMLHWHGDTFDVPAGTELLARTAPYAQAFRRGRTMLALQCHPEMGEDPRIDRWLDGAERYVASAGTDIPTIRADYAEKGPRAVAAGRAMMAEWLAAL